MKQIGLLSALIISGFLGGGGMVLADTDPTLPCYATVDADLNVIIPCLEVNGGFHSAVLERIQNPQIGGQLEWQLKSYTEGGGLTLGTANGAVSTLNCQGITIQGTDTCDGLRHNDGCDPFTYLSCSDGSKYCGSGQSLILPLGATCSTKKLYTIGEKRPGGGIVFYITDGGEHGLEISDIPYSADTLTSWWGNKPLPYALAGTSDAIGQGLPNTLAIIKQMQIYDPTSLSYAALYAYNFVWPDGRKGGFLPSKLELAELLKHNSILESIIPYCKDCESDPAFWSSTEVVPNPYPETLPGENGRYAWSFHNDGINQNFWDITQKDDTGNDIQPRAVRAF